jgi:predicted hydrocarbon binding protein
MPRKSSGANNATKPKMRQHKKGAKKPKASETTKPRRKQAKKPIRKAVKKSLPVNKAHKIKKPEAQAPMFYPGTPDSYYHMLIKSLESDENLNQKKVSAESIMFSKLIVFSTINDVEQYKAGLRIGKLYYSELYKPKGHKWYEDSIPTLISLLQRFGYKATYIVSERGNPVIRLKSSHEIYLGYNVHTFESGIISGFLSIAKGSYVHMYEHECSCNGYDECIFDVGMQPMNRQDIETIAKRFASHMHGSHINTSGNKDFSAVYNAVILAPIKHSKVQYNILRSFGEYLNTEFLLSESVKLPERMVTEIIRKVAAYSNFEESGSGISITFDPLNSDSSYMESLSQFIKGLTGDIATVSTGLSGKGLSYELKVSFGAKLLKLKNK